MRRIPVMLVVSLLALCLTATAAFAAKDSHRPTGPNVAAPTTVISPDDPGPAASDADESEAPEADESEAPDADSSDAPGAHPTNHGLTVSEAAQATTPPGCKNHGQYVSMVARGEYDPNASAAPLADGQSVCDQATDSGQQTTHGKAGQPHGKK